MKWNLMKMAWLIILLAALTGCSAGSAVSSPSPAPTETEPPRVARISTPPPSATPIFVPATSTPVPPTAEPTASATPSCVLQAAFIADVTIPDGSVIAPNAQFVKTWRVQNSSTCDWGDGFTLVFVGGDQLGGPATTAFPPTKMGGTRDISMKLRAPAKPGAYEGKWRLYDPDGVPLTAVTVSIVIPATPTPTSPPTLTPKPTLVPTYAGSLDSFLGDWRVVEDKFGGNTTDTQRLFKIQISNSGSNLLITPMDLTLPASPYAFTHVGQVSAPYAGGREFQVEFDDPARGHVTIKMSINKACNAWAVLTYAGFRGRFLIWNTRPRISCE